MPQRLQYRRLKRPVKTACCDSCDGPLKEGQRTVYDEESRGTFCSQVCAARDYRTRPIPRPKRGA